MRFPFAFRNFIAPLVLHKRQGLPLTGYADGAPWNQSGDKPLILLKKAPHGPLYSGL